MKILLLLNINLQKLMSACKTTSIVYYKLFTPEYKKAADA